MTEKHELRWHGASGLMCLEPRGSGGWEKGPCDSAGCKLGLLVLRKLIFIAVRDRLCWLLRACMHACIPFSIPLRPGLYLHFYRFKNACSHKGDGAKRGRDVLESDSRVSATYSGCWEWVLVRTLVCAWTSLMNRGPCALCFGHASTLYDPHSVFPGVACYDSSRSSLSSCCCL